MASPLQAKIREYLEPHCKWIFVTTAGRLPGATKYKLAPKGFPDIIGMTEKGKPFFIEVKRPKEKVRDEQTEFIKWHHNKGYLAFIADSLDVVKEYFKRVGYV